MRRKTLLALTLLTLASASSLSACGSDEVEVPPVETTSEYNVMRDTQIEETEAYVDTTGDVSTTFEILKDSKAELQERNLQQAKEGFEKLKAGYSWADSRAQEVLAGFLDKVGLDYEELATLSQEELYEVLVAAGYSDDQVYCFSVIQWLLEAETIGDEGDPENYFSDTKSLLEQNGLDYDKLIGCRNADELNLLITESGLSAEELNAKLYFNNLFPGVDIDAQAILEADDLDDLLDIVEDAGLTSAVLREKANASNGESSTFVNTISELEVIKAEEEAQKSSGSSGNSSSGSSNSSRTSAEDSLSEADSTSETLGDAGDKIVTVAIGNGAGYISSSSKSYNENYSSSNTKGTATVVVGDDTVEVKISVKRVVRGEKAEDIISGSNSILPGSYYVDDLPDDYEPVAVKFTVTTSSDDDAYGITAPYVRVRTLSGANIDDVATRVYLIQPDDEDYEDETTTKTYWIAFMIPDDQTNFALYFGDSSSTTYIFKTTSIDVEDEDDD